MGETDRKKEDGMRGGRKRERERERERRRNRERER